MDHDILVMKKNLGDAILTDINAPIWVERDAQRTSSTVANRKWTKALKFLLLHEVIAACAHVHVRNEVTQRFAIVAEPLNDQKTVLIPWKLEALQGPI